MSCTCSAGNGMDDYADHSEYCLMYMEGRIKALEAQLPDEMQECTIVFKECEQGHGRLTATNWIQHDCLVCRIRELENEKV